MSITLSAPVVRLTRSWGTLRRPVVQLHSRSRHSCRQFLSTRRSPLTNKRHFGKWIYQYRAVESTEGNDSTVTNLITDNLFDNKYVTCRGIFKELSVQELSGMIKHPSQEVQFVDVREPWELDTASLPLFKNIPLGQLTDGGEDDLNPNVPTVLLCHHGRRSRFASDYLMEHGFLRVFNVTGGIDAYSRTVDPTVPVY